MTQCEAKVCRVASYHPRSGRASPSRSNVARRYLPGVYLSIFSPSQRIDGMPQPFSAGLEPPGRENGEQPVEDRRHVGVLVLKGALDPLPNVYAPGGEIDVRPPKREVLSPATAPMT
jgi:hypothetical protein